MPIQPNASVLVEHIRQALNEIETPSWYDTPPRDFFDPKAGSIKAAEWRNLYELYAPLSMIRMWGTTQGNDASDVANKEILKGAMSLVCALLVLCKDHQSDQRAQSYRQHLKAWMDRTHASFPEYTFKPTDHAAFHMYEFIKLF